MWNGVLSKKTEPVPPSSSSHWNKLEWIFFFIKLHCWLEYLFHFCGAWIKLYQYILFSKWGWDSFLCPAHLADLRPVFASEVVICLLPKDIYSKQDQGWPSYILFPWKVDILKLFCLVFSRHYSKQWFCSVIFGLPRSPNCSSNLKPTFIVSIWIYLTGFSHFIFIVIFNFSISFSKLKKGWWSYYLNE